MLHKSADCERGFGKQTRCARQERQAPSNAQLREVGSSGSIIDHTPIMLFDEIENVWRDLILSRNRRSTIAYVSTRYVRGPTVTELSGNCTSRQQESGSSKRG